MFTGSYYVYVDFGSCTSYGAALEIKINNVSALRAQMLIPTTTQGQTRSNAAILFLNNNDELKVSLPSGMCIYGGSTPQTTFQGFLLSPAD